MLERLPAPVHRAALRVAHRLRLIWWRLVPGDLAGCNVVVTDRSGAVLLVRHSYNAPTTWMLPGGAINRGESPEAAAVREVREETGCRLDHARVVGTEEAQVANRRDLIHLVAAETTDTPQPDGRELIAARFFALDDLPAATGTWAKWRIERWRRWADEQAG